MSQHIERVGAAEAMGRARKNAFRKYPAPGKDGDRLYPFAAPQNAPSFRIEAEDTIFALGSCFARRIETALEGVGNKVLSAEFDLGEIGRSSNFTPNFFNKYSVQSMTNELRWALERESFPGAEMLYPAERGGFVDCQLGAPKLDFPLEKILEFRHRYLDVIARAAEADVVIITLGYVETWYDNSLGLYLNSAPPVSIVKAEPDRFEFRVLSYNDVLQALEDLYALLLKHRDKPLKMLATVSPVPLATTFREMDILTANAYSKAVQRAALDQFLIGKTGIDYFPSYETVTLSDPNFSWSRGDFRHVAPELVERIMSSVLKSYVTNFAGNPEKVQTLDKLAQLRGDLRKLAEDNKFQDVVNLLAENREIADRSTDFLLLEANSLRALGRLPEAWEAAAKAVALSPGRPSPLERMILLCRPMRKHDEAKALFAEHARRFPAREAWRQRQDWIE